MHGYDPKVLESARRYETYKRHDARNRAYSHATYFSLREISSKKGRFALSLKIHPDQVSELEIKHRERWTLVPWSEPDDTTAEERQQRVGTLALLRHPSSCPSTKLSRTGWAIWKKHLWRDWLEEFLYRNQPLDAKSLHIPETRVERDGNEVALVIDPRISTFVPNPYSKRIESLGSPVAEPIWTEDDFTKQLDH